MQFASICIVGWSFFGSAESNWKNGAGPEQLWTRASPMYTL
jgi:hypothetical protein